MALKAGRQVPPAQTRPVVCSIMGCNPVAGANIGSTSHAMLLHNLLITNDLLITMSWRRELQLAFGMQVLWCTTLLLEASTWLPRLPFICTACQSPLA